MKKIVFLSAFLLGQLSWAGPTGYCVPKGKELSSDNATVQIVDGKLNGFLGATDASEHFFDQEHFQAEELYTFNWAGIFSLRKVIYEVSVHTALNSVYYIYHTNLHGSFPESYEVLDCVESNL